MSLKIKSNLSVQKLIFGLVILAAIAGMYFWFMPDKNWQGVKVESGKKETVKLPDGSTAQLTGPAELGYPKVFKEKVRSVKIEGEIYFEIVSNPNKTFIVQSENGGIETHGTKVVIHTKIENNITVHCMQDSLRMIARGKKEVLEINLKAGEMGSFTRGDGVIGKQAFDTNSFLNSIQFLNSVD